MLTGKIMTGTKNGGGAPSRHSFGYRGPPPKLFFYILRPRGHILDKFWPMLLSVLAHLRKAFAVEKIKI